jgi:hypothetical protein
LPPRIRHCRERATSPPALPCTCMWPSVMQFEGRLLHAAAAGHVQQLAMLLCGCTNQPVRRAAAAESCWPSGRVLVACAIRHAAAATTCGWWWCGGGLALPDLLSDAGRHQVGCVPEEDLGAGVLSEDRVRLVGVRSRRHRLIAESPADLWGRWRGQRAGRREGIGSNVPCG